MARGSNSEIQTQLILAATLGFGDPIYIAKAEGLAREVAKMLDSLIHKL
jgi:four helix bundle protein